MELISPTDSLSHSADLTTENIERLRELFPQAVTEDGGGKRIDFDVLRELLGGELATGEEKYGLNWHGKRAARRLALTPSTGTLRPAPEDSVDWHTTQNLMIEGDNLEVLKLLQKSYAGKIKMIYIDPPYNTGNDFVYKDDFRDSIGNYQRITGQLDEEGAKLTTNAESSGRFHTDWLNMMYPRLMLARTLLKANGSVYISCDDHEVANLTGIMDQIFGEENHVVSAIWQKRVSPANDAKWFSSDHDYVLCYARDKSQWAPNKLARTEAQLANYKNPDADPRGVWNSATYTCNKTSVERPNLFYPIRNPNTGEDVWPKTTAVWKFSKDKTAELAVDKRLYWGADGRASFPRVKLFLNEMDDTVPRSIWSYEEVGHTQEATTQLKELFDSEQFFDAPKPVRLIERTIDLSCDSAGDIVLDFFAGSGTTGHACYSEIRHGKKLHFILVQMPEVVMSGKHQHIAEITEERLRRAAAQIKVNNPLFPGDLGFRVFKLDTTSIRPWDPTLPVTEQRLLGEVDNILPGRAEQDLLYELLLKRGLELTVPIVERTLAGKKVFAISTGDLIACLAPHIESADVEALAEGIVTWHKELAPPPAIDPNAALHKPAKFDPPLVVFRDTAFADDVAKSNLTEILKQHNLTDVRSL